MSELPRNWVDPDTGYTIYRLSDEPGSSSLYFNRNGYTPGGDFVVISTPTGLAKVHLSDQKLTDICTISQPFDLLCVGFSTRTAYYILQPEEGLEDSGTIMAVNVDTGETRHVYTLKAGYIQSINADETLLGGVESDPNVRPDVQATFHKRDKRYDQTNYQGTHPDGRPMTYHEAKGHHIEQRFEARVPMRLFVIDIKTGQKKVIYESNDWMNHLLFCPTDPGLLLYCHEGPWHRLNRLWLIRVDTPGAQPKCIHHREVEMEIAGHEWWSADGKTVWYDLQTPKGHVFWIAGYNVETGERIRYHVENRDDWGVHFHSSTDDRLFVSDGGAPNMVADAKDGKWLSLLRPQLIIPDRGKTAGVYNAGQTNGHGETLVKTGYVEAERIVNLREQDYRLEPNVNFSPDGRWLVYRANIHGGVQTYAADLQSGPTKAGNELAEGSAKREYRAC